MKKILFALVIVAILCSFAAPVMARPIGDTDHMPASLGTWITLPAEFHMGEIFVPTGCSIGGFIDEDGVIQLMGACD